jgi:WD40 repeat protein
LATASVDQTVKLWDGGTGVELRTLRGHTDFVLGVAFSPDGQRLASASSDKTVRVWDGRSGRELLTLRGHMDQVTAVAFSPGGQRLASASFDKTVKVWDGRSGQELLTFRGHSKKVLGVAYSPDGQRLASAGDDQTARVWDAHTGQELLILRGHYGVTTVAFSPDAKRLATAGWDETVKLWDGRTGQELLTLRGHTGHVTSVAYSPDGHSLASGGWDQTVKVWDAPPGRELLALRGHTDTVYLVQFSPDGQHLASASRDATVKVWDWRTGQDLVTLRGHADFVSDMAFSPDGQRLVTASYDKTVKVWHWRTGQELFTLQGHTRGVGRVTLSPDGKTLFSADIQGEVLAWNLKTGKRVAGPRQRVWSGSGFAARHPSQPLLAVPGGSQIRIIDLTPPDAVELGLREAMARFDVSRHLWQGNVLEKGQHWYAAAFHWGQLAQHYMGYTPYWEKLGAMCARSGDWRPVWLACDRVLSEDATQGPVYFLRARLRAGLFQFHGATAEHLAGLALAARNPVGWSTAAGWAGAAGNFYASQGDWPRALQAYTDAAWWQRQDPVRRQWLALAQLAANHHDAFCTTCRQFYEHYRTTQDVDTTYRLAAELGLGLSPGPSCLRGLGTPQGERTKVRLNYWEVLDLVK